MPNIEVLPASVSLCWSPSGARPYRIEARDDSGAYHVYEIEERDASTLLTALMEARVIASQPTTDVVEAMRRARAALHVLDEGPVGQPSWCRLEPMGGGDDARP